MTGRSTEGRTALWYPLILAVHWMSDRQPVIRDKTARLSAYEPYISVTEVLRDASQAELQLLALDIIFQKIDYVVLVHITPDQITASAKAKGPFASDGPLTLVDVLKETLMKKNNACGCALLCLLHAYTISHSFLELLRQFVSRSISFSA